MDAGRFDALSRSLATRRSRRSALQGLGAGGLAAGFLAVLGAERAPAASGTCALHIFAKTSVGPHKDKTYSGTLNFTIGDGGAIDSGSFDLDDGSSLNLVGQATGRALNLRITLGAGQIFELNGTADIDLLLCRGDASGVFGGPSDTDIGTWRTGTSGTSGGSSGTSTGGGSTSGSAANSSGSGNSGTTTGGGSTSSGSSGGNACASGVVCNGVCCAPAPGLTPDRMVCNAGACECTYSCAAAGCSGGTGKIVNTCGSDPQPHCHSECNVPATNGCGDTTCGDGTTLDADSCTCVADCQAPTISCGAICCPSGSVCTDAANGNCNCPNGMTLCGNNCVPACAAGIFPDPNTCQCAAAADCGGADLTSDPNNCGACGTVCDSGSCLNSACVETGGANDPCTVQGGQFTCAGQCADLLTDADNCGDCGVVCDNNQTCVNGFCL